MARLGLSKCISQFVDVFDRLRRPARQIDDREKAAFNDEVAAIVGRADVVV
jgi:hypothetical protein